MGYTQRWTEQNAVVANIDPDAYTAATYTSGYVDMKNFRRVVFIVQAGTLGTNATVDFTVKGDTATGGSYTTTITGKAITQLTEAGTDSDKQAVVEVTAEEVFAQGFRYIRGALVIGTATSDAGMIAIASEPRYFPASDYDASSVDEIVA